MSQYTTGTVDVTNGSAAVVGTGTAFLANVTVGAVFTKSASGVPYVVGAVADDTHLTLSSNYAGTTESGISYSITNSFTPNLGLPYPDQGDIDTATILKRMALMLDGGALSKSVAGSADVTLTSAEARNDILVLTGALTGNINVIVPTIKAAWIVHNNTSGNYTLTVKTAAGTGIAVTQGQKNILYGDGTNINSAITDQGAWAPYTPTLTASSGTITSGSATGRYLTVCKTTFISLDITITTAGTAATQNAVVTLPNTSKGTVVVPCYEIAVIGKSGVARRPTQGTTLTLQFSDTSATIQDGYHLLVNGCYENL